MSGFKFDAAETLGASFMRFWPPGAEISTDQLVSQDLIILSENHMRTIISGT